MTIVLGLVLLCVFITAIRLFFLQKQVADYRKYWQEQAKVEVENPVTLLALGDSSAQGIGASHPTKSYVGLLAKAISQKTSRAVVVKNISVSGARISDVTEKQIPQLQELASKDTIMTLSIGGNDMRTFEPSAFRVKVDELFKSLPKHTVVSDIAYFGGGRYRHYQPRVEEANKIMHEVAANYGLSIAPLHEVTKSREFILNHSADILHPSNRGYRNWFDAFWPKVEERLENNV